MAAIGLAITGGLGALGRATAALALERGLRVALIDRVEGRGPEGTSTVQSADLGDPADAARAIDAAAAELGGLDALINIAGAFRWQTLADGAPEAWRELYAANVLTAANASRAALPHLLRSTSGRIVNVGANGAVKAGAGMGAYAAAKAGVHKLTESLAEELKGDGVTVNAVLPSVIDTPANRADMPDADFGAWVAPRDLAAVILFLCSPEACAITGALIPVVGRV